MKRLDIYYADLRPVIGSEQGGIRPVLIIQNNIGNKYAPTIAIASITAQIKKSKLPTHVEIDLLEKDSVILLEQIRTIDKRRLREHVTTITDSKLIKQINEAIKIELGLEEEEEMNNLKLLEKDGLIKIYQTDKGENVVNARELYYGLGNKRQFADWVKQRINEVDAVRNEDYILISQNCETSTGGTAKKEYILKLDIAKEMAMLERNEKGKEYRRYLISIEKKYNDLLDTSKLSPELQMFNTLFKSIAKVEIENKEIKKEIQDMRNVISLDTTSWRKECRSLIVKIAQKLGGNSFIKDVNTEIYTLLDKRMGIDLKRRLTNKRYRMAEDGICKSKREKINYVDVIADDKKLIEGYIAITKEMSIKYGVA